MKQIKNWEQIDRWHHGCYNPSHHILLPNKVELESGHGDADEVHLFQENEYYYVLVRNTGIGYVGLQEYSASDVITRTFDGETVNYLPALDERSVFLQADYEVQEVLGENWEDLGDSDLLNALLEYLPS
ncbi:MAG: hypothetical protein AAB649_01670 [Patescibacteria group bacterium]